MRTTNILFFLGIIFLIALAVAEANSVLFGVPFQLSPTFGIVASLFIVPAALNLRNKLTDVAQMKGPLGASSLGIVLAVLIIANQAFSLTYQYRFSLLNLGIILLIGVLLLVQSARLTKIYLSLHKDNSRTRLSDKGLSTSILLFTVISVSPILFGICLILYGMTHFSLGLM